MVRSRFGIAVVWTLASLLGDAAFAQEPPSTEPQPPETDPAAADEEPAWTLSANASEEYRFRHTGGDIAVQEIDGDTGNLVERRVDGSESDHDLRLSLDGYLWEKSDHFAGDLSAAFWSDLDGIPTSGSQTSFASVDDYQAPQAWHDAFDVYSLYGEYHSENLLSLARAGRQVSEYGYPVTFDGATVRLAPSRPYVDLSVFGGRTVHFFELSPGLFEDWLASGAVTLRPLRPLRVDVDYRYVSEDIGAADRIEEHFYGLTAWYRITELARLKGYLRNLNDSFSNAGGSAAFEWSRLQLGLDADVDGQLITLGEINESDNPYFAVLGRSSPHLKVDLSAWKAFTTAFGTYRADLGWQKRFLTHGEPTAYNRDFGRVYLLLEALDIVVAGPFASLVLEYNYVLKSADTSKNSLFVLGGSVGYEKGPFKATAGSHFYRYRYDYYADVRELNDLRSYFGELRYRPFPWLSLRCQYGFEQSDRDIHTVTFTVGEKL